jgi:RHS repeat-associated protein
MTASARPTITATTNRARLDRLTIGSTVTADYTYDGLERLALRVTQNMTPAGTTHYVYDRAGHLIVEADSSGNTLREYVWLDDTPLAVVADVDTMSPKLWFVHADHLDRPIKMTDGTQAVVWDAVYRPFGEVVSITGSASNNLRFPGQYYLLEDGLHYNWHRHYDPTIGRYLQADPLGLVDGPSRYSYARSTAVGRIDPLGLETVIIINRNAPWGWVPFTGQHSGVATGVNRESTDNQVLYDPAGDYRRRERGSGDALMGDGVNLDEYVKHQLADGPNVEQHRFDTTPQEEQEISKRIEELGGATGLFCARRVSQALDGIGPFKGLGSYWRPNALGNALSRIPGRR